MSAALAGKRVLLTRSKEDNHAWAALLRVQGLEPLTLACVSTAPLAEAAAELARELARCDWLVLSSRCAVAAVRELLGPAVLLPDVRVACVGPATAAAASAAFGRADKVAPLGTGRSLGAELAATLPRSARVLVAGAEEGRVDVEEVLRPAGLDVRRVAVYRTTPAEPADPPVRLADLALDAVFLASPSAVRGLRNQARVPAGTCVVTLGPTTTSAARAAGLAVHAEARARGLDGMCAAYAELLDQGRPSSRGSGA